MKTLRILLVTSVISFSTLLAISNANAGALSSPAGVSISWDDSSFYIPSGCTSYVFTYTATSKVLLADILITNKFSDKIGSTTIFGPNTGKTSVQVCSGNDFTGTKVSLDIKGSAVYGGTDDVVSTPIAFLSRSATPTTTPAPIATVTAKPVPAPTVTVTANPVQSTTDAATRENAILDKLTIVRLEDELSTAKLENKVLKAKMKKICAAKPKPKGC